MGIFIILQSKRYSGQWQHQNIHPCLLLQSHIHPTSSPKLSRPLQRNPLSKLTNLIGLEMMHGLDRIHQSYVIEIWVHLEQTLSQVLRGLEILQVSSDVFAGVELFAFGSIAVVSEDDDFVDFEDAGNSSDFADEVSPEWRCLRDFQDGIGEANGKVR